MSGLLKIFLGLLLFASVVSPRGSLTAQEKIDTPSQKTREAIQKFSQTPATISKSLEALKEAVTGKLQQALGEKPPSKAKAEPDGLTLPPKKAETPAAPRFSREGKRDPFRPATLKTKTTSRPRENLSPLERVELGQLKVVGIVWDIKEPRAMVEDSAGLGYVVKVGTPIGSNEGKIKAIHRSEVVVEEFYSDFDGAKKKKDVSMRLSTD